MTVATEFVQRVLDRTSLGTALRYLAGISDKWEWKTTGPQFRGSPPHVIKRERIKAVAIQFKYSTLIETGTYLGDMVQAMLGTFDQIHSVELAPFYYARACRRFARRPSVHIHQGNSAKMLPQILSSLKGPALIWLDAHYSGGITARTDVDSPIERELQLIAGSCFKHAILIDDAHMFTGSGGYPRLSEMEGITQRLFPDHSYAVHDNIIELLPHGVSPMNGSTRKL